MPGKVCRDRGVPLFKVSPAPMEASNGPLITVDRQLVYAGKIAARDAWQSKRAERRHSLTQLSVGEAQPRMLNRCLILKRRREFCHELMQTTCRRRTVWSPLDASARTSTP